MLDINNRMIGTGSTLSQTASYSSSESSPWWIASNVSVSCGHSFKDSNDAVLSRLLMSLLGKEVITLYSSGRNPSLLRNINNVDKVSDPKNLLCSWDPGARNLKHLKYNHIILIIRINLKVIKGSPQSWLGSGLSCAKAFCLDSTFFSCLILVICQSLNSWYLIICSSNHS